MRCPFCDVGDTHVVDSRTLEDGRVVRRRRVCDACKRRFTTYERLDMVPIFVIKKSGQRVSFNRHKLFAGLVRACEKRPITISTINEIVDSIERKLMSISTVKSEVTTMEIGELALEALKKLDQVAYVRFASVYREFADVDSFMAELKRLKGETDGSCE